MFNYEKEKQKLDRELEFGRLDQKKYNFALARLNEASEQITQLKADLEAGRVDGKKYNFKELEIIRAYDAALTQKVEHNKNVKKKAKNIFYFISAIACFIVAGVIFIAAREGYKHRSIANIPEPEQEIATGEKSFDLEYTHVELEFIAKYSIEGVVIAKEKFSPDDIRSEVMPYAVGLAWGYAAEHNNEISWAYNNRNIKAESNDTLDRIKITTSSSMNELIPANEEISKQIDNYYLGDHVTFKGYLVKVSAENAIEKFEASSSRVRGDTTNYVVGGASANEIIYVTDVISRH